ncbi:MAG: TetR/AcrR family transcriptional regulator [Bacteroidota bacterium]
MEKRKPGRPSKNDSRRVEILDKAASCFTLYGYNKTTLDDIGDALGFNKAALYYYFKNKEELFSHVMSHELERLFDILKSETEAVSGFDNKMIKYFEVRTDVYLGLFKLNGLSKDNIINLNESLTVLYIPFKEKEIDFLIKIVKAENFNYKDPEIRKILNLIIETQSAITMSSILLNNIEQDKAKTESLRQVKNTVLKHFLHSIKTNYIP